MSKYIDEDLVQLCEWTNVMQTLEEDDDNQEQNDGSQPNFPDDGQMNGSPMPPSQGQGQDNGDGGMPNDMNPMDGGADGGNPPMDAAPPMGDEPMDSMNPMGDMGDMPMGDEGDEDNDYLDVEDLTDAQETMNTKVNKVGKYIEKVDNKLTQLFDAFQDVAKKLEQNESNLEDFKAEFMKRNPTQNEKLELRTIGFSGPYTETPADYWAKATKKNGYDVTIDDGSNKKNFDITEKDVESYNPYEIHQSLEQGLSYEDKMRETLRNTFK